MKDLISKGAVAAILAEEGMGIGGELVPGDDMVDVEDMRLDKEPIDPVPVDWFGSRKEEKSVKSLKVKKSNKMKRNVKKSGKKEIKWNQEKKK